MMNQVHGSNLCRAIYLFAIIAHLTRVSYSQELTANQTSQATLATATSYASPAPPSTENKLPSELCLVGVWSFEATTYVVPGEPARNQVQTGHWAVTYEGGAYMTAYLFDKDRMLGQKFLLSISDRRNRMTVERVDVLDGYSKQLGICRLNDDASAIELAFNQPLDGSPGKIPNSFDPKTERDGFVLIKLRRLSDRPKDQAKSSSSIQR